MYVSLSNNTDLTRKKIHYIKWRIYQLQEKFRHLLRADVFLNSEGTSPREYQLNLTLRVAGPDIFVTHKSENPDELIGHVIEDAHRYIVRHRARMAE